MEREATSGEQREESVHYFFKLENHKGRSVNALVSNIDNDNVKADPMYLKVMINGKNVSMEIDSGSYASIISNKDRNKYFPDSKITRAAPDLKAYGKVPLESEGIVEDELECEIRGSRSNA